MKYLRRQNLNLGNVLDDTVLQTAAGNVELNPTQRVTIRGDLEIIGGAVPGPEVTNVMYVTTDGHDDNSGMGEGPLQAKRTLKAALAVAQQGTTIYVRSGEYYEDNPLRVPPKVSIIGDNLRNTIIRPLNGPQTFNITNIQRTNEVTTITLSAPHGLSTDDRVRVRCSNTAVDETDVNISAVPASNQISFRQYGANITSTAATGVVKWAPDLFLVNSANFLNNMVFKGLQSPAYCVVIDSDAIVDTSPYVQNCSNINGPWMRNGDEWLPFQTEQPDATGTMVTGPRPLLDSEIDPTQVDTYGIDIEGAGGGMLIDGDRYNSQSPIKSMVGDAFTQVCQGGIGFHITNFGYMQLVSCFAVFCSKAFYTTRGGYLSISNSVIDFGTEGFVADGYYLDPYSSGITTQDWYSNVASVSVLGGGTGYTSPPTIVISPPTTPGGIQATAVASIDPIQQTINAITITDPGDGYDAVPTVTVIPNNGVSTLANLAKNQYVDIFDIANKPQIGSVMFIGDIDPLTGNEIGYYVHKIENENFTFKYDEIKCRRDIGLILEAVLNDAVLDTNHAATYAGLSYLRSYSSKVTSLQKSQTIDGLNEARDLALTYTSNTTLQARITSGFNIVTNIIQTGYSAAPAVVNNPTTPRRPGYYEAAQILLTNKTFIQDELEAWIALNYPTLVYDVATCRRDISFITDALAYDLTYEGNTQTCNAALAYGEGSVIAGQTEETQAAYEYWKTIVGRIVKNELITKTTGNPSTQNTSGSLGMPVDPNGPSTEVQNLVQIVIDVVDHGTGYVPDPKTPPNTANGNVALLSERTTVLSNTENIQDGAINYLNTTYGGNARVWTFPLIQKLVSGTIVRFHNVSTVSTASTALEYVGAGVTYNALPFFGGEPIPANERTEINNGKCFTVTSDQLGNYRIGEYFTVNAITGEVSIVAENLNLSGLSSIGPFRRNGVPVGAALMEVSNNANLVSTLGFPDVNTVPTQEAVVTYVENRYLNKVQSGTPQTVESNVAFIRDVEIRGGDLTTDQSTFNLLNTTATTVNAFGAATDVQIGSSTGSTTVNHDLTVDGDLGVGGNAAVSGDLQVGGTGGEISSTQTTFNLLNTTVTTLNFGGAATAIEIGAATGTTSINHDLTVDGSVTLGNSTSDIITINGQLVHSLPDNNATAYQISEAANPYLTFVTTNASESLTLGTVPKLIVSNTTDATNSTTASATFAGGVGIAKKLFVGTDLTVDGSTTLGNLATADTLTVTAKSTINIPDNDAAALLIQEAANGYITVITTNTDESVTIGTTPKLKVLNTTDSTTKDTGALIVEGGVGIEKNLTVGVNLLVDQNATVTGDLAVNGGDITTTQSSFNLLNANATTVNAFGAATTLNLATTGTTIEIGAATGTTNINNNLDVDGDVNIDGGDLTVSTSGFNLANTTATTVNFAGAATAINMGAATGTLTIGNPTITGTNATSFNMNGANPAITSTNTGTASVFNSNITTGNLFGTATTINIGVAGSSGVLTIKNDFVILDGDLEVKGGDLTTNQTNFNLLNTNATTVNAFGAATTLNLATAGTTIEIGASTGTTNINNNLDVDGDINIDGGNLTVSTTTFNLANTTATTVNAFGAATTLNLATAGTTIEIGAATGTTNINNNLDVDGNVNIDGGDLTVSTTTFNLANTTATTVNFAGAATTIEIGAATGTTNINNDLDVDGDVNIDGGDLTVSTTTFNLANANATTVNFAGDATAINIGSDSSGARSGVTNIAHKLVVEGTSIDHGLAGDITGGLYIHGQFYYLAAPATGNLSEPNYTLYVGTKAAGAYSNNIIIGDSGLANLETASTTTVRSDYTVLDGDLEVKGGDLTTNQTTFNLLNATATTVNFAGAATTIEIGAATGTTNINNDLDVDGDVNIDGGDLTVSTATFNLANTTATTINFAGDASTINLGSFQTVVNIGTSSGNSVLEIRGLNPSGTATIRTSSGVAIANVFDTEVTTGNMFGVATAVNIGTSAAAASTLIFGPAITGNQLKISGTASGTVTVTSDVTTGVVDLFNNVTTGSVNIAGGGASTINIGGSGSTVNAKTLTLTTALEVQYGGTGQSSFTTNGVIYGNNTSGLLVTAASNPGSNATTSYGILTTDGSNVPTWTDVIDGGSY